MTDKLIPFRNIHPCTIFFRQIAVVLAESSGIEDEDEQYKLEEEISQFLKGGVMTESIKLTISSYFNQNPQVWQNLWDNYINHPKGKRQSYDDPSVKP